MPTPPPLPIIISDADRMNDASSVPVRTKRTSAARDSMTVTVSRLSRPTSFRTTSALCNCHDSTFNALLTSGLALRTRARTSCKPSSCAAVASGEPETFARASARFAPSRITFTSLSNRRQAITRVRAVSAFCNAPLWAMPLILSSWPFMRPFKRHQTVSQPQLQLGHAILSRSSCVSKSGSPRAKFRAISINVAVLKGN